jgi:hypothetical protein
MAVSRDTVAAHCGNPYYYRAGFWSDGTRAAAISEHLAFTDKSEFSWEIPT